MMNNDKKPNFYKPEEFIDLYHDAVSLEDNTQHLLNQERTRYTKGANAVIKKVQQEFLEKKRTEEIDLALELKDKERFMALTSDGWEEVI
jgi:uncharacterized protein YpiB (UPF0302 family)